MLQSQIFEMRGFPLVRQLSFSGVKCIASLSKCLAFKINASRVFLLLKPPKMLVSRIILYPHFLFLFCSKSIILLSLNLMSVSKIYKWAQHFWFPLQTLQMTNRGFDAGHPRRLWGSCFSGRLWYLLLVAWAARPSGEEGKVLRKKSYR